MRRGFVAAAVAGAAGITIGLMPVSSAFASGLPQTYDRCSDWRGNDWRGGDWWRDCCDSSRGNDRPSWCWDDVRGWYHDSSHSNWNHDDWNDSWRGGNGDWGHDDWNDSGRGGNGDWGHDNWNHDNRHDGGWNDGGWNDGRHDWSNWNN
ncbi:hypothetical protein [Streptomyces sp. AP-93]|uniref:hypothetical protein n=1 Tax=Streptomyces sp. AP-93 TaxID=2929048 RepID=UPI001FAF0C13|nr:hypothetical protein [Streptomyces sp. AP-93]